MDLGALSDQVEIMVYEIGGGHMTVDADLGPDNDGFHFLSYPNPVTGSLTINVEGGSGNDDLFVTSNLGADVPAPHTVQVTMAGDSLDRDAPIDPRDNVADHGVDLLRFHWPATVGGSLNASLRGDDVVQRLADLECVNPIAGAGETCVFRTALNRPGCGSTVVPAPALDGEAEGPCDLEEALQTMPNYAADDVQGHVVIREGSTGRVNLRVDGGLSNDIAVLVVEDENDATLGGYEALLTGGRLHRCQHDVCYAGQPPTEGGGFVEVENCAEMDPTVSDF